MMWFLQQGGACSPARVNTQHVVPRASSRRRSAARTDFVPLSAPSWPLSCAASGASKGERGQQAAEAGGFTAAGSRAPVCPACQSGARSQVDVQIVAGCLPLCQLVGLLSTCLHDFRVPEIKRRHVLG